MQVNPIFVMLDADDLESMLNQRCCTIAAPHFKDGGLLAQSLKDGLESSCREHEIRTAKGVLVHAMRLRPAGKTFFDLSLVQAWQGEGNPTACCPKTRSFGGYGPKKGTASGLHTEAALFDGRCRRR